jgi:type IV fimbrial biogenesis protein FimT
MRSLTRGLTLIEVMVALAISAFLLTAASPYLGDYATNSTDTRGPEPKVLRTRALGSAYVAEPATVEFGSNGMPSPFGTATEIDLGQPGATCSAALRCPGLRIDGGGAIHLCANKLSCP